MIRSTLIFLSLLAFTACSPVQTVTDPKNPSGLPIYFLDDHAAASISFLNHRAERLPSGHLSIAFTCQGLYEKKSEKPVVIDWRVVFFDRQHFPADETEWHTEYLLPGEVKMLQAGSIRTDCTGFQVQMRTSAGGKRKQG